MICCPHEYYNTHFREFVNSEVCSSKNSWIYDIISNGACSKHEQVFLDRPEWCLVLDKHHGHDIRYLVVFKDVSLRTIRDLRQQHLKLLEDVFVTVSKWLTLRSSQKHYMYFNYMPSVFQLHLHVNCNVLHINKERAHFIHIVCAHLRRDSEHYTKALILTKMCGTIRRANVHTKLALRLPDTRVSLSQQRRTSLIVQTHAKIVVDA